MKEVYERYYEHFVRLNTPTEKAFKSVAKSYAAWYKKFLPLNKDARILDVGCGMGQFLYFLKSQGYTNFFGIDISEQQVNFVKENISGSVVVADAFAFLKENGSFQLIVVNDIIEHIPKEKVIEFLHLIFDSLEIGGLVFVKTDNMSNPFSLRSRYMDITHEVGFTEHSLLEVLNTTGFQDIRLLEASSPGIIRMSLAGKVAHRLLKLLFLVQGYPPPKILTKDVIGIAVKK